MCLHYTLNQVSFSFLTYTSWFQLCELLKCSQLLFFHVQLFAGAEKKKIEKKSLTRTSHINTHSHIKRSKL